MTIKHKRGDTFILNAVASVDGTPVNLTGYTIAAQIRFPGVEDPIDLTFTAVDLVEGEYTLSAEDTTEWTVGPGSCDIQYTQPDDNIFSTKTFTVLVVEDITR